jgi:hypothetical protein
MIGALPGFQALASHGWWSVSLKNVNEVAIMRCFGAMSFLK